MIEIRYEFGLYNAYLNDELIDSKKTLAGLLNFLLKRSNHYANKLCE